MRRQSPLFLSLLALAVLASGCPAPTKTPRVELTGPVSVQIGATVALTATTYDGIDGAYEWTSSDPTIATVDVTGTVTGIAAGTAEITAKGLDTAASAGRGIVVLAEPVPPPTPTVAVAIDNYLLGISGTATATATTANGTDASYTWSSSDDTVATVDASGVVTGVGVGEAVITATGDDTGAAGDVGVVVVNPFDPNTNVPYYTAWSGSGHADTTAEPFNHWNGDTPPEVPTTCARCHTTTGYQEYIGADGSTPGTVETAVPVGEVITCNACHNAAAQKLDSVTFPSGVTLTNLGPQARCQTCHQGRESTVSVDAAIGSDAPDTIDTNLGFLNVHYFAAGATLNGSLVHGAYEFSGQSYDKRNLHVDSMDTCIACHDQHSLKVRVDKCQGCHSNIITVDDTKNIRMMSSMSVDYNGNGDTTEGIYYELDGLRTQLLTAMQSYTSAHTGMDAICYDQTAYPYFFKDTNANGSCDSGEASFSNSYKTWTPNLLRAAYNLQYSYKDPGDYAHNPKYVIEVLYDSLNALDPANVVGLHRDDPGHFNGSDGPFHHWDSAGVVDAACAKCHGGEDGLHFYLKYGVGTEVPVARQNGLQCQTCHADVTLGSGFPRVTVASVTFPSGVTLDSGTNDTNLCSTCHSGRESGATVQAAIDAGSPTFKNVHHFVGAATLFGGDAKVGYEYPGKTYAGRSTHPGGTDCTKCHAPIATKHTFQPNDNISYCQICHKDPATGQPVTDVAQIRGGFQAPDTTDWDGDGNVTEPIAGELAGFQAVALTGIQGHANAIGHPICYDANAYPYFFNDTNGNGTCDAGEATFSNQYKSWDAMLAKCAFNYQFSMSDPGAWAHNFKYMAELLYDSANDCGAEVFMLTRP